MASISPPADNWISRLSPALREEITASMTIRDYADKDLIYRSGEPGEEIFQVVSGYVRMYTLTAEGKELVYTIFEPGCCFGEMSLIDNLPRFHMAQAFGEVRLAVLSRADFDRFWASHPEVSQELCRFFVMRERRIFQIYDQSSLDPLPVKITHRLLSLADTIGEERADGIHFDMRITQEDIGFMVAASRQSVNKVLGLWRQQGLIKIEYGNLVITDVGKLRELAATAMTAYHPV
ncbi:Crp/Fnr family transcriptional regulator [Seongchinamella sediminis]|uniref:Crp/Fnr family transcriptional regulator n=1 Tax=Seongchinamella sediminis TaxID=2283635 RepID=A0A3L7DYP2_9GAMM|nr:Crp/Fnr family transcriptional regulator [Seongchinamella sediminis]RLQ22374.1 Crp/Fnr family transcriptional regulator [Seongchinamella sediminis]